MEGKERYQLRKAAGVYWLLDMEQTGVPWKKPVAMNECGAFIWQQYTKNKTAGEIAGQLQERYAVSGEEAGKDVLLFMKALKEQGIVCGTEW